MVFKCVALGTVVSIAGVSALQIVKRSGPLTNTVCRSGYEWSFNQIDKSPCWVASQLQAQCNNRTYFLPLLDSDANAYPNPGFNDSKATLCSCSWSVYNLMSACADCQGFSSAISSWSTYTSRCGSFVSSDTFYDERYLKRPLETRISIPYWAVTNPIVWPNQKYDSSQARAITDENRPDVQGAVFKDNIGMITGLVCGGIVVLFLLLCGIVVLVKRNRSKKAGTPQQAPSVGAPIPLQGPGVKPPTGYTDPWEIGDDPFRGRDVPGEPDKHATGAGWKHHRTESTAYLLPPPAYSNREPDHSPR